MDVEKFYRREWDDLAERTRRTAEHFAERADANGQWQQQADSFANQEPPSTYPEFLDRCREAAGLALQWRKEALPESDDTDSESPEPKTDSANSPSADTSGSAAKSDDANLVEQ